MLTSPKNSKTAENNHETKIRATSKSNMSFLINTD